MAKSELVLSTRLLWKSWAIVFSIKLLFCFAFSQLIFLQKPERKIGNISYASGDYYSYIGAMENYFQQGKYYFVNQVGDTIKAGRSPHFTLPYLLARHFTSRTGATDFLSIVNIVLGTFAILCMAIMASVLRANSRRIFYVTIALGMISTYVSNWDFITLPDSPGASLMMIGLYYFWKAYSSNEKIVKNIFLASFFFSWAIMLRPFLVVIILAPALIFLFRKKNIYPILGKVVLAAVIPFLLFILPWVVRNYQVFGKFVPFQQDVYAGYGYQPAELQTRKLMTAMGEDGGSFWDPTAMASYFSPDRYTTSVYQYPGYVKEDTLLMQTIEEIRKDYFHIVSTHLKTEGDILVRKVDSLRSAYIQKYKWRFYLTNPLKRTVKFWGHSGSYYISVEKGPRLPILGFKIIQSALYYLVLILGAIGLLRLGRKNEIGYILLLPLVFITIMSPLLFGFMEPRYALSFYYPAMIGLVLLLDPVLEFLRRKKNKAPLVPQHAKSY